MRSVSARLEKVFDGTDADAILIMNNGTVDSNFLYLVDFQARDFFERAILIAMRRETVLITDPREYGMAERNRAREMVLVNAATQDEIDKTLARYLRGKTVGINGSFLPVNLYKKLRRASQARRFVDATKALSRARSIKSEAELQGIRAANTTTKLVLAKIQRYFKEGITEKWLADKVDDLMLEYGATGSSFRTIVAFGETSAFPHYMPSDDRRLERNSFILIDCGARQGNYCADLTRTFIFKPDKKSDKYRRMVEMYNTVKEAQAVALSHIRPGVRCEVPHIKAKEVIDSAFGGRYKGKFTHGLGHAIGIDVHDLGPNLRPGSKDVIQENMVFSDEPGIYVEGFGGVRIEDDVVVTRDGGKFM